MNGAVALLFALFSFGGVDVKLVLRFAATSLLSSEAVTRLGWAIRVGVGGVNDDNFAGEEDRVGPRRVIGFVGLWGWWVVLAVFVFRVGIGEVDAGSGGRGVGYFVAVTNAAWREDVEGLDGGASEGGLCAGYVGQGGVVAAGAVKYIWDAPRAEGDDDDIAELV